ncbi:MAG: hypothetical protein AAFN81_02905 [Bacteroidota bacterium]
MTTQRSYQFGGNSNSPFSGLVGIVIGILFFIAMFWFVQIVFRILWFLLPVILIATAVIDYTVITGYLSWIGKLFKRNTIAGIAMTVLTVIGAPVVGIVLLGRALFRKKVKEVQAEAERQREGEFVEYEDLGTDTLELPPIEPKPQKRTPPPPAAESNDYDDMFK